MKKLCSFILFGLIAVVVCSTLFFINLNPACDTTFAASPIQTELYGDYERALAYAKTSHGKRLLSVVLKDIMEEKNELDELETKNPKIAAKEENELSVGKSFTRDLGFIHPFTLNGTSCMLKLGNCLGVGCDGPIWSCSIACEDGFVQKMGVKFKRNVNYTLIDSDWSLEDLFKNDPNKMDHFAIPVAKVKIPKSHLNFTRGRECKTFPGSAYPRRKCGKLFWEMFEPAEQEIVGDVLPWFKNRLCQAREDAWVREYAVVMFRDLATTFQMMARDKELHCDFNHMHVGFGPKVHGLGMALKIFDLNRKATCSDNDQYCEFKLKAQMFQFGSLIIDFCNPKQKCMKVVEPEYMWTSGACKIRKIKNPDYLQKEIIENAMPNLEKKLNQNWDCPKQSVLKQIVRLAYKPVLEKTALDWEGILNVFDSHIGKFEMTKDEKKLAAHLKKHRDQKKRLDSPEDGLDGRF